jgi:hypothetical protein
MDEKEIEKLLRRFSPETSRNMCLNMVANALGNASHNATHVQQQMQTILVISTAIGSGLIYSVAVTGG